VKSMPLPDMDVVTTIVLLVLGIMKSKGVFSSMYCCQEHGLIVLSIPGKLYLGGEPDNEFLKY
jgi:hypothetical protein